MSEAEDDIAAMPAFADHATVHLAKALVPEGTRLTHSSPAILTAAMARGDMRIWGRDIGQGEGPDPRGLRIKALADGLAYARGRARQPRDDADAEAALDRLNEAGWDVVLAGKDD